MTSKLFKTLISNSFQTDTEFDLDKPFNLVSVVPASCGFEVQFNAQLTSGAIDDITKEESKTATVVFRSSESGADGYEQSLDLILRMVNALSNERLKKHVQNRSELANKVHELAAAVDRLQADVIDGEKVELPL